jgi:hypothetical protein
VLVHSTQPATDHGPRTTDVRHGDCLPGGTGSVERQIASNEPIMKMPLTFVQQIHTFCAVNRILNIRLENALLLSSAAVGF